MEDPRNYEIKHDAEKPRMDLIPTSTYRSLGAVLTFGANKYGTNTWKAVEPERYVAALIRHLCAFMDDPYSLDDESGLPHTAHILANAAFLNDFIVRPRT